MNLEDFLKDRGVSFEKHAHGKTYTAQELAHEEHVSGYMVAKPVIVNTSSGFAMCVLPAPRHVNLQRVAEVLGEADVRLATEAEMADLFPGCELGAEPPVGAMFGMKTVMDQELGEDDFLVMQAGTHTAAIKMRRDDWQNVCAPIIASITQK
jgi:Ala-tRNA(Pro) deacylase